MKLDDFYARIGPFLEGQRDHAAAVAALGMSAGSPDAERLAIYGRFCRAHRFEAVDKVFAETRRALITLAGEPAWAEIVSQYFAAHPMHHWEINENGSELPAFLRARGGVPDWLPELAELEWWEWRTLSAPDEARDAAPDDGPLRLASTVELRPFAHRLVDWLDDESRAAAPSAGQSIVIFWRDRALRMRRENCSPEELAVLKAVHEGAPPPAGEVLSDLRAAGIILGRP